jgi:hypothetical protein
MTVRRVKRSLAMQIFRREGSPSDPMRRRAALGVALAMLACGSQVAAGCGSGSPSSGVAQVPTSSTTTQSSQGSGSQKDGSGSGNPAAYSACMRSHGVPKFPDPDSKGRLMLEAGPGTGIDPESAQFKAADQACRKLAPKTTPPSPAEQARDRAQFLRFSACMRAHGLPKFPDPSPTGGVSIGKSSGLNPRSPQFKAAEKACDKLLPGDAQRETRGRS